MFIKPYASDKSRKTPRILVVDDLTTNRNLITQQLQPHGYEIYHASNGLEACKIAEQNHPDLILMDIMMPKMNGLEACRQIKQNISLAYIPIVILTTLNETDTRIDALNAGADDFLNKPVNPYELKARVQSLVRLKQYYDEIQNKNNKLETDLIIAQRVQYAIVPKINRTRELDIYFRWIPCHQLAGDYIYIQKLSRRQTAIFIGDVMGHGVAPSLVTMTIHAFFDNKKTMHQESADLLFKLNNHIEERFRGPLTYISGIYLRIDHLTGQVDHCNAGHPPALLFNEKYSDVCLLESKGTAIGLFPNITYEQLSFTLEPHDKILLYTDGITEVQSPDGSLFGQNRLVEFIQAHRDKNTKTCIEILLGQLYQFNQDRQFSDDVSMLMLEFLKSG